MSMEDAAKQLISRLVRFDEVLRERENREMGKVSIGVNRKAFDVLNRNISLFAIEQVNEQWVKLSTGQQLPACTGSYRKVHLLPCAHDLQIFHQNGRTIPLSMVHPRWRLEGRPHLEASWVPSREESEEIAAPTAPAISTTIHNNWAQATAVLDRLTGEERDTLDRQLAVLSSRAVSAAKHHQSMASIPVELPDRPLRKVKKPRREMHGQRQLTAAELSEKDLRRDERAAVVAQRGDQIRASQLQQQSESQGSTIEPFLTELQTAVRQGKRPLHLPTSTANDSESSDDLEIIDDEPIQQSRSQSEPPELRPPLSTAPPALTLLGKRPRPALGYHSALNDDDSQEIRLKRR